MFATNAYAMAGGAQQQSGGGMEGNFGHMESAR